MAARTPTRTPTRKHSRRPVRAPATKRTARQRDPEKDRGAIFDAAVARDPTILRRLPPEAASDVRRLYVEHASAEWTEESYQSWREAMLAGWRDKQTDRMWRDMRSEIEAALVREKAFSQLDKMELRCDRHLVHNKVVEEMAEALDRLRRDRETREGLERLRRYAESELEDAISRMGMDRDRFERQKATAEDALADLDRMEESYCPPLRRKEIADTLHLHLFGICRHVTHARSEGCVVRVSQRAIYEKAMKPILRAFAGVEVAMRKRTKSGTVQVAPKKRLQRLLAELESRSAEAADTWRDGRPAESRDDLILRVRWQLFAWDPRFPSELFRNS